MTLPLHIFRYPSADGRRWSTQELADLADHKITNEEVHRIMRAREQSAAAARKRDYSSGAGWPLQ